MRRVMLAGCRSASAWLLLPCKSGVEYVGRHGDAVEGAVVPFDLHQETLRELEDLLARGPSAIEAVQAVLDRAWSALFLSRKVDASRLCAGSLGVMISTPDREPRDPHAGDEGEFCSAYGFGTVPAVLVWDATVVPTRAEGLRGPLPSPLPAPVGDTRRVRLWHLQGPGLILPASTGVVYTNQTGGNACKQPEQEGVFVPLDVSEAADVAIAEMALDAHYLRDGSADAVDEVLARYPETAFMKVDRTMLGESMEAWIYVVLDRDPTFVAAAGDGQGSPASRGVLTWWNSD